MSEKLTPAQIEAVTKAVEAHLQSTGTNQVSTQQVVPTVLAILNQLPTIITNFIVTPIGGVTTALTGLLNALIGALTGTVSVLAGSGIAPNLVNIIKQHVPTQGQNNPTQPPQQ